MGNGKKKENDIHSLLLSTFYIGASRQCLELVMSANSPLPLCSSLRLAGEAFVFHLESLITTTSLLKWATGATP